MIVCIDGMHIPIKAPSVNKRDYVNSFYSINVQVGLNIAIPIGLFHSTATAANYCSCTEYHM